jgi:hypothetical protein
MTGPNALILLATWLLLVIVCRELNAPAWLTLFGPALFVVLVVVVVTV